MSNDTAIPTRLDFTLHEFLRISWVNDHARDVWGERARRVVRTWPKIEFATVALGKRNCALLHLTFDSYVNVARLAARHGLSVIILSQIQQPPNLSEETLAPIGPRNPDKAYVAIGRASNVVELSEVWSAQDAAALGSVLGYPHCCTAAFVERSKTWRDHTWNAVASTLGHTSGTVADVEPQGLTNILWRYVGIRHIPHLPCRLDCSATERVKQEFLESAQTAGFSREIRWAGEILSWPLEWSALHGIVEIKAPIMKIATNTDATREKLTIRWKGSEYPSEGVRGVRFPYLVPSRLPVTDSKSFQRGLHFGAR